ncbi:uncharacterized protein LOC124652420 [Lolium rigidum]|uniref:uncharacterized protein LOC124652420 n=1 Tax=Lolium rigidum TaxID=89674 RepID=UPI001F5CC936|nr:uncharacterized protein LOC124652420 [Lolium rigidum]
MDMDAAPALKRKGADASELWLDDGGTGFPAAFRATKSRRLDADVPPVVPGAVAPPPLPQTQLVPEFGVVQGAPPMCGDVPVVPVEVAAPGANEERAIVLYRPAEATRSLLLGPLRPGAPLRVCPDWIQGLKGTMLQEANSHGAMFAGEENSNLAMVPWAPWAPHRVQAPATATEMMDAEDTSMDVEQDGADQSSATHQQWPQHCMVPQPLPAASYQPSPVTWSW